MKLTFKNTKIVVNTLFIPNNFLLLYASTLALLISTSLFGNVAYSAEKVNIYSYRQVHLVRPLLDEFTKKTEIETNVLYINAGIAERMQLEGTRSPADLILTTDVYRLAELKNLELTQPVRSGKILRNVPATLRDPDNHWFGLTKRVRVIYASDDPKRAPLGEVASYSDLARNGLGDRICIRPLSHIYNLGLTASLIAQNGLPATEDWLRGVKKNLARKPQGNDRAQIKGITRGVCDYAVANSYYFALLAADDTKWTRNIRVITPTLKKGGTHVNISGMALARYAPNAKSAKKLMEFLTDKWAQAYYASVNNEFPVVRGIQASDFLNKQFGDFEPQQLSLDTIAGFAANAQEMVNRIGIDN